MSDKQFIMKNLALDTEKSFSENTAPKWLTCENTVPGSTMDDRWFWEKHVLTLEVGESIDTDFRRITRTA
jgi:hypothetical protein